MLIVGTISKIKAVPINTINRDSESNAYKYFGTESMKVTRSKDATPFEDDILKNSEYHDKDADH